MKQIGGWLTARRPRMSAGSSPGALPAAASEGESARLAAALSVFAEIDRGILSGASSERIVFQAVKRARAAFGYPAVAVTLLETEAEIDSTTVWATADSSGEARKARSTIDPERLQFLLAEQDGVIMTAHPGGPITPLAALGLERVLQLPVFRDADLAAVLTLGLAPGAEPTAAQRTCARALSDRLGVAITASARGENLRAEEHYDSVTRLPNRRLLQVRLSEEIARAKRGKSEFAVMFIGLDNFRRINENLGHATGDGVLEASAHRIREALREQDVVARFGGDEFVAVLPSVGGSLAGRAVAEKMLRVLMQPLTVGEDEYHVGASMGVCVYPHDGRSIDELLRRSSSALSRAKAQGRGQYVFFKEEMNTQVAAHAVVERELRHALLHGELTVMYQPQVDLLGGQLVAAEALVRWQHPERGLVAPNEFIAIAEHSGLIEDIGDFVRAAVCAQYREWSSAGIAPARISINVSGRELRQRDFVERLASTLNESGMRPYCLELEVTESLLVDESENALATLQQLHERGFRIALDDFGTGYSCLSYLKQLPFDVLKIDRAFVRDIETDEASDAIITAIIRMAQSLGKELVCEGVETERQRAFLSERGCEVGQGYLWGQALSAGDFTALAVEMSAHPAPLALMLKRA